MACLGTMIQAVLLLAVCIYMEYNVITGQAKASSGTML